MLVCVLSATAADGVKTWTSESNFSGPNHSGTATATGTVTRTGEGVAWESDKQGMIDGEKKWQATTTGSGTKTADGYKWSSTAKGTTEAGKEWTTSREVDAVKNEDGTLTINRDATTKLPDGQTLTRESQTTITKTEEGKTWSTTGTQTGPRGTATMSGSGAAVKTDEGVSVNISRQGTTAGGKTWQSTTTGTGTKSGADKKWSASTVGAADNGQNWQVKRECETTKNGFGGSLNRKGCLGNNSAGSCVKPAAASSCHGNLQLKKACSKQTGK